MLPFLDLKGLVMYPGRNNCEFLFSLKIDDDASERPQLVVRDCYQGEWFVICPELLQWCGVTSNCLQASM